MRVYVIIEDEENNLYQAHITEPQSIISNLVECYPDNSMTKDFVNNVVIRLAKNVDFKEVE